MKKIYYDDVKKILGMVEFDMIQNGNWCSLYSEECDKTFFGICGNGIIEILQYRNDVNTEKHATNILRKLKEGKYNENELKNKFGFACYKGLL